MDRSPLEQLVEKWRADASGAEGYSYTPYEEGRIAEKRKSADELESLLKDSQGEAVKTPGAHWRTKGEPDPHGSVYDRERSELPLGDMTDDELANAVFMHGNVQPPVADLLSGKALAPIAYLTAAKERIRWLSRALSACNTAPQPAKCQTCNGVGMIGGPTFREPDEGGVNCPDCEPSPPAAVQLEKRMRELPEPFVNLRWDTGFSAYFVSVPTEATYPMYSAEQMRAALAATPAEGVPIRLRVIFPDGLVQFAPAETKPGYFEGMGCTVVPIYSEEQLAAELRANERRYSVAAAEGVTTVEVDIEGIGRCQLPMQGNVVSMPAITVADIVAKSCLVTPAAVPDGLRFTNETIDGMQRTMAAHNFIVPVRVISDAFSTALHNQRSATPAATGEEGGGK